METRERIIQSAKTAVSFVLYYTGALAAYRNTILSDKAVILMYHRVVDSMKNHIDYSPDGMMLDRDVFEMQMDYVSKNYRVVPLSELVRLHRQGRPLGGFCSITFDDGWKDVYVHAYPVLRKYDLCSTVFITTDYVEGKMPYWEERLRYLVSEAFRQGLAGNLAGAGPVRDLLGAEEAERFKKLEKAGAHFFLKEIIKKARALPLERRNALIGAIDTALPSAASYGSLFLNWAEIEEMASGGVEFGSHTVTHTSMGSCDAGETRNEIMGSKRIIEEKLTRGVDTFAYPYGKYNAFAKEILKASGYNCACSTMSGFVDKSSDRWLLKRINIHQEVSFCRPMFACRIASPFNLF